MSNFCSVNILVKRVSFFCKYVVRLKMRNNRLFCYFTIPRGLFKDLLLSKCKVGKRLLMFFKRHQFAIKTNYQHKTKYNSNISRVPNLTVVCTEVLCLSFALASFSELLWVEQNIFAIRYVVCGKKTTATRKWLLKDVTWRATKVFKYCWKKRYSTSVKRHIANLAQGFIQ